MGSALPHVVQEGRGKEICISMPGTLQRAAHPYAVVLLGCRHGLEKLKEGITAAPLAQPGADVGGIDGP
jgi:hypothetical protein